MERNNSKPNSWAQEALIKLNEGIALLAAGDYLMDILHDGDVVEASDAGHEWHPTTFYFTVSVRGKGEGRTIARLRARVNWEFDLVTLWVDRAFWEEPTWSCPISTLEGPA